MVRLVKLRVVLSTSLWLVVAANSSGAIRSWDNGAAGSNLWSSGNNWSPNGVPQPVDDLFIGSIISGATLFDLPGTTTHARSLTMSNSSSLDTGGREVIIDGGATVLNGAETSIVVRRNTGGASLDSLDVDSLTINSGALVRLDGGVIEVDTGQLEINAGGVLSGYGRIDLEPTSGGQLFENSGRIEVTAPNFGADPGELTIRLSGSGSGTIDLDGDNELGVVDVDDGATLASGALTLTIDAPLADSFGGTMEIGQADRVAFTRPWQATGATIDFNGRSGVATLSGSRLTASSTAFRVNSGTAALDAELVLNSGAAMNLASGATLVLSGGDLTAVNRIAGGTVTGSGILAMTSGHALHGFGTIQTAIDFDGSADLRADDGVLTVTGAILDVRNIGTNDEDGVLNVVNPWSSSGFANISLIGGEVRGGAITVDNSLGIRGHGLVSARVVNNTRIEASLGTLVVGTAGNDNDWDGATNTGALLATQGTLELRDNVAFEFNGLLDAGPSGSGVLMNGFTFDFGDNSRILLRGGYLRSVNTSTGTTDTPYVRERLEVISATSRINVPRLILFSGSLTTLAADLELDTNYTAIAPGATVSGPGTLVQLPGGLLRITSTNVGARIYNQGNLDFGAFSDAHQTTTLAAGFVQSGDASIRFVLDRFENDRLFTPGAADLAGGLEVVYESGINFGQTYELIAAGGGVFGAFQSMSLPNAGPGLGWSVVQTANSFSVRLGLAGDYNGDDVVDAADYTVWRDGGSPDDGQTGFNLWAANYGAKFPATLSTPVPEPAGAALLLLCGLAAMQWKRKR